MLYIGFEAGVEVLTGGALTRCASEYNLAAKPTSGTSEATSSTVRHGTRSQRSSPSEVTVEAGPTGLARAPGFLFPTHHPPSRPGGQVASSPGAGVALQLARSAGLAFGLG